MPKAIFDIGRIGSVHLLRLRIDEANVSLEKARSPEPAALLTRSRRPSYPKDAKPNLPPPNLPKPVG
jgi:hypothetical protein